MSRSLRKLVGPSRRWSYASVSKETGIDVRTLKSYVQGAACPNLVRYKRLLAVLGPEVGEELNRMQGMLPRRCESPPEALDLVALRAELARASSIVRSILSIPPAYISERSAPASATATDSVPTKAEYRNSLKPMRIDRRAIAERFGFRLAQMIGEGRRWSLAEVADATDIDARTLRSYRDGTACPNLARYMRLLQVLGPESGYELALMLGWQPRFRIAPKHSAEALRALDAAALETCAAVDELIGMNGLRFLSPSGETGEPAAGDASPIDQTAASPRITRGRRRPGSGPDTTRSAS
ncbi:MAG: hypothetical protein KF723_15150 [Rhizobiaceae bacterium]|nr:hypothetical protein [Rhizobiaceae bacterium]